MKEEIAPESSDEDDRITWVSAEPSTIYANMTYSGENEYTQLRSVLE